MHATLCETTCTLVLQILSSKQLALIFVHAYPYMPVLESILDHIAAREGYPAQEEVIASAERDPMTAAWRDFDEYAMYIHKNMFSEERAVYIPLSMHVAPRPHKPSSHQEVCSPRPFTMP